MRITTNLQIGKGQDLRKSPWWISLAKLKTIKKMATLGSKLITKEQQWHANLTEHNHLGKALLIKPEIVRRNNG